MKFLLLVLLLFSSFAQSKVKTLDDLMKLIQKERVEQTAEFQKREARFKKQKQRQAQLLTQAQAELYRQEAISRRLQGVHNRQEKEILDLQNELQLVVGNLGELFGVVRQVAGDFRANVASSITSAQIKGRLHFLDQIADARELPNIKELRQLWIQLQLEATELGAVKTFKAPLILSHGKEVSQDITRIGGFNLVSKGKYLSFREGTGQILELSKQPASRFLSYIKDLESAQAGEYTAVAIDPARGALLSVLLKVPTLQERLAQGGFVGCVIICLFFFGLVVGFYRWSVLIRERKKLNQELHSNEPNDNNPIGKLRLAFKKYQHLDVEAIDLKLEEILIRSLPIYEKGIGLIKILASVAPLLGLLGTVIGMIQTFQSITLFGTGDPKIMAGGISQALITTCLGLMCAIPLLFLHSFVSSKSKELIQIVEEQLAGLIAQKTKDKL